MVAMLKLAEVPEQTGNIMDRAVCLSVELHGLGTKRKVNSSRVDTDADRAMIHVSKDILESKALADVKRLDGEIRSYINSRCLPSLFRAGVYLLPVDLIEQVDGRLEEFAAQRAELVEQFITEYQHARDAARARLGSLYDDRDYPGITEVREAFSMETRYIAFNTPSNLKDIAPAIWRRETEKAKAAVESAAEEIRQVLRAAMADLVDHMVERLSPKADGSQKVFRDTLVGNLREFLETFQARNITDDGDLAAIVQQARACLGGASPEALRQSPSVREKVRAGFESIKNNLDTMLVDKPRRRIYDEEL